ncbi:hypothetical protein [Luedemannella helvata]|uniref:Lipoprotein n=1 Tax=Luedemannella helvata TaxID=349315 RepID=A0ABN2KJD3_9ACTN
MKNRLIAVAILGGVLLAGAACDSSGDTTTTSPTTAAAAPATSAPASGTAPKAECDKAQATVGKAFTKFLAAATTAQTSGKDAAAVQKDIQKAATTFVTDLSVASSQVEDPTVKKALEDWVLAVSKKASAIKTVEDVQKLENIENDPDVKAANDAMDALCGA